VECGRQKELSRGTPISEALSIWECGFADKDLGCSSGIRSVFPNPPQKFHLTK